MDLLKFDLGVDLEEFTHSLLPKYVNKVLQKRHVEYLEPNASVVRNEVSDRVAINKLYTLLIEDVSDIYTYDIVRRKKNTIKDIAKHLFYGIKYIIQNKEKNENIRLKVYDLVGNLLYKSLISIDLNGNEFKLAHNNLLDLTV